MTRRARLRDKRLNPQSERPARHPDRRAAGARGFRATDVKTISATPMAIATVPVAPTPPETVITLDDLRARVRASLARSA